MGTAMRGDFAHGSQSHRGGHVHIGNQPLKFAELSSFYLVASFTQVLKIFVRHNPRINLRRIHLHVAGRSICQNGGSEMATPLVTDDAEGVEALTFQPDVIVYGAEGATGRWVRSTARWERFTVGGSGAPRWCGEPLR